MSMCVFEQVDENTIKCKNCEQPTFKSKHTNIGRQCNPLTYADKVARFAAATATWAASGFGRRKKAVVKQIYFESCKPCEFFVAAENGEEGACRLCGCRLTPNKEIVNKIAWSTESCPHPGGARWSATEKNPSKGCGGCG